mgnify:CR=1 FL=1
MTTAPTAPTGPIAVASPTGPGNVLVTNAAASQALATVQGAAHSLGFRMQQTSPWTFQAQKGSLAAGIFLGAFIAYCNFGVTIAQMPDGMTAISIVRNRPWWTGAIGVMRVKKRADELGNAVGQGLVAQQLAVLNHTQT